MPVDVDLSHSPQYLVFSVTGRWPDAREQTAIHERLHADGRLTATMPTLVDLRLARIDGYQHAEQTVTTGVRNAAWPVRCALLVGSVVQYGFSRQLQALSPASSVIEIFTDESKARQWLLES